MNFIKALQQVLKFLKLAEESKAWKTVQRSLESAPRGEQAARSSSRAVATLRAAEQATREVGQTQRGTQASSLAPQLQNRLNEILDHVRNTEFTEPRTSRRFRREDAATSSHGPRVPQAQQTESYEFAPHLDPNRNFNLIANLNRQSRFDLQVRALEAAGFEPLAAIERGMSPNGSMDRVRITVNSPEVYEYMRNSGLPTSHIAVRRGNGEFLREDGTTWPLYTTLSDGTEIGVPLWNNPFFRQFSAQRRAARAQALAEHTVRSNEQLPEPPASISVDSWGDTYTIPNAIEGREVIASLLPPAPTPPSQTVAGFVPREETLEFIRQNPNLFGGLSPDRMRSHYLEQIEENIDDLRAPGVYLSRPGRVFRLKYLADTRDVSKAPFTPETLPNYGRAAYQGGDVLHMDHVDQSALVDRYNHAHPNNQVSEFSPLVYNWVMSDEFNRVRHGGIVGFVDHGATSSNSTPTFLKKLIQAYRNNIIAKPYVDPSNPEYKLNSLGEVWLYVTRPNGTRVPKPIAGTRRWRIGEGTELGNLSKKQYVNDVLIPIYDELRRVTRSTIQEIPNPRIDGNNIYVPSLLGMRYKNGGVLKTKLIKRK